MLDFDEIRKEVAIRHNLLLTPNDPVLVTITLNELVLREFVSVLIAENERHLVAISLALDEHVGKAKETGGRVITEASSFVADQTRKAVAEAVAEATASLKRNLSEAKDAAAQSSADREAIRVMRGAATLSALIAGAGAILSLVVLLVTVLK